MKKVWNYISEVWQGDDGKLSIKRLLVIILTTEVVRMIEKDKIINDQTLSAFYAILGTIVITLGIVTIAQLMTVDKIPFFKKTVTSETSTTVTPTNEEEINKE